MVVHKFDFKGAMSIFNCCNIKARNSTLYKINKAADRKPLPIRITQNENATTCVLVCVFVDITEHYS